MVKKRPFLFAEIHPFYFTAYTLQFLNQAISPNREFDQINSHTLILRDITFEFFSKFLDEQSDEILRTMTFQPILEKLAGIKLDSESILPRFWAGLISKTQRFCPHCITEEGIYKLLWQVNDITVCEKHLVKLQSFCPRCGSQIPLLSHDSQIGYCQFCMRKLDRSFDASEAEIIDSNQALHFWRELGEVKRIHPLVPGYSTPQAVAAGLIFLKTDGVYRNKLLSYGDKHVLEIFRGTSGKNKVVHISKLFEMLKENGLSIKEFANLKIPPHFIDSLANPKKTPRPKPTNKRVSAAETNELVLNKLNEWVEKGEEVTIKRIYQELGVNDIRLKKLGLTAKIIEINKSQMAAKRKLVEEEIRKKFDDYIGGCDERVTMRQIFGRLGYYRSQIRVRYPELYPYIRRKKVEHNCAIREMNVSELIAAASEVVSEKNLLREFASLEYVAEAIGIHPKLLSHSYPEVVEFIRKNRIVK